jgi:hypothetical protein
VIIDRSCGDHDGVEVLLPDVAIGRIDEVGGLVGVVASAEGRARLTVAGVLFRPESAS